MTCGLNRKFSSTVSHKLVMAEEGRYLGGKRLQPKG